jgi:CrcB protein
MGAFIGGVARYAIGVGMLSRWPNQAFPWQTFAVNVVGCLAAGVAVALLGARGADHGARLFFVTGILGGMTTFSAFGIESVALIRGGALGLALVYVFGTIAAGFLGLYVGLKIAGGA